MSRAHVPASLERRVRLRAGHRCEYGGPTTRDNLALACVSCSLRKGARTIALDPRSAETVRIFDPRAQTFREHFAVRRNGTVARRTASGRATVELLQMNRELAIQLRLEEIVRGREP